MVIEARHMTYEETPETSIDAKSLVQQLLDTLPGGRRRVLELRYGVGEKYSYTLEETARVLGRCRSNVRGREVVTLDLLRRRSERLGIGRDWTPS